MGLDVSHGCWEGAYTAFHRWRFGLARAAGLPPLGLMEGFYAGPPRDALEWIAPREGGPRCNDHRGPWLHGWIEAFLPDLPIKWEALRPDPLHLLLNHSDCDGELPWEECEAIAARLEELTPLLPTEPDNGHIGDWAQKTLTFATGLRAAAAAKEKVYFH